MLPPVNGAAGMLESATAAPGLNDFLAQMLAAPDGAMGSMSQPEPLPPPEPQGPEPIRSELDRWAMKRHGVLADQLNEEQLTELAAHVEDLAKADRGLWGPRNERQLREQDRFDLRLPDRQKTFKQPGEEQDDQQADEGEVVLLPDPFLFVNKVDSMLAMAGISWDMPARGPEGMSAAQEVEAFLEWWFRQAGNMYTDGDLLRDVAHDGDLRGWMCALLITDLRDEARDFPWRFKLVDSLDVFPRETSDKLLRVTHQYTTTAMLARGDYPEGEEALAELEEDDEVAICGYYDEIYHLILLTGGPGKAFRALVKRPVRHGTRDFQGRPIVPWIIVKPVGNARSRTRDGKPSTENLGLGLLFGIEEMYLLLCKIVSELATNVARSADPALMHYIDPANPNTTKFRMGAGARNYAVYSREKVEILDTAPNPGNLQPLMQVVVDRLNKLMLPSVAWGDAGSVTSGYGVSLLSNQVKHLLAPYGKGIETFFRTVFRRVLESYYWTIAQGIGPIEITRRSGFTGRRVGGVMFDAGMIDRTGVDVDVTLGEITPQDEVALTQTMVTLTTSGLYSRYRARKKLGIKDPMEETRWQALEAFMTADPQIALMYAQRVAQMSDDEFLQIAMSLSEQQKAAAAASMQGTNGNPGAMATGALPLEQQIGPGGRAGMAPAENNPQDIAQRDKNALIATLSGGSPPARRFAGR